MAKLQVTLYRSRCHISCSITDIETRKTIYVALESSGGPNISMLNDTQLSEKLGKFKLTTIELSAEGNLDTICSALSQALSTRDRNLCCNNCSDAVQLTLRTLYPDQFINSVQRTYAAMTCCCGMVSCCCFSSCRFFSLPCSLPDDAFSLARMIQSYQRQDTQTQIPTTIPRMTPPPQQVMAINDEKKAGSSLESKSRISTTPLLSTAKASKTDSTFFKRESINPTFLSSLKRYVIAKLC